MACAVIFGAASVVNAAGKDSPVPAGDRRPHLPQALDLTGPLLENLAVRLEKDRSSENIAAVSKTLRELAEEFKEMYRLSMATSDVRQDAENLVRKVADTAKAAQKPVKK